MANVNQVCTPLSPNKIPQRRHMCSVPGVET